MDNYSQNRLGRHWEWLSILLCNFWDFKTCKNHVQHIFHFGFSRITRPMLALCTVLDILSMNLFTFLGFLYFYISAFPGWGMPLWTSQIARDGNLCVVVIVKICVNMLAGSWLAAQEWTLEQPIRCQVGKLEQLLTMTQTQKFPLQWSQAEELVSILKRWQGVEGQNVDDDWWGTRRVPQEEAFELASGSCRIESVDSIWCKFLKDKKFNTLNF